MTRTRYIADNPPPYQPPDVPARSSVPQKQNPVCIRTVSAPQSPSSSTVPEQGLFVNIQPLKTQETKVSVVANLRNLKKKFQKKRSNSQDNTYAEINMEASDCSGKTENEYQEISGEPNFSGSPLPHTCTDARTTNEVLPPEYLQPPPFAPGFWNIANLEGPQENTLHVNDTNGLDSVDRLKLCYIITSNRKQ